MLCGAIEQREPRPLSSSLPVTVVRSSLLHLLQNVNQKAAVTERSGGRQAAEEEEGSLPADWGSSSRGF